MKFKISTKKKTKIQNGMIGLFFEDINYAADGGLYADMIENHSFEFMKVTGEAKDYQAEYEGNYAWSLYPIYAKGKMQCITGSPHSEANPHYMRIQTKCAREGIQNKAYEGIFLKKDMEYKLTFWVRCIKFKGEFNVYIEKNGCKYAQVNILISEKKEETYNHFCKYETIMKAEDNVEKGMFVLSLSEPGIIELDFVSLFPCNAVCGIFRKDLFDMIKDLHPGFLRFPGGCIVEGNTLANRYQFKDTLKPVWDRKNNWNRWATHGNSVENQYESIYCHYNQTLGLGYYEYFLLCELIEAKPLPVLNVGFACQYQSDEMINIHSSSFQDFLQDALDLIEFANGDENTRWGSVRAKMGHKKPFELTLLGIGNEQWQTFEADFFERYEIFEKTIHKYAPYIKLIGSAGPDVISDRYDKAWKFYHIHEKEENFVYAVDEHYYVKPQWFYDHVNFYDNYSRKVKVFSGEYAAHPTSGFNKPEANTLEAALAEAAFLTGIERNSDVVYLASYAPLLARLGYTQWSPDMIWFDAKSCYGSPSYYVQKMYACNMGDFTLHICSINEAAVSEGIYYCASLSEKTEEIIFKIINSKEKEQNITLELPSIWDNKKKIYADILTGTKKDEYNSITEPKKVIPYKKVFKDLNSIILPPLSFTIIRIGE